MFSAIHPTVLSEATLDPKCRADAAGVEQQSPTGENEKMAVTKNSDGDCIKEVGACRDESTEVFFVRQLRLLMEHVLRHPGEWR